MKKARTALPSLRSAEKKCQLYIERARTFLPLRKLLGAAPSSVDLHFATTPEMVELNQVYRSKKGPTDVLSFPAPAPFRKQGHLGEIVICRSVMVKQAKELGHRPSFELDALLVHGLLHLLGFDHEEGTAEAKKMAEWEVRLLGTHARGAKAGSKLGLISRVNRGNSKP